jgi:hypothetical protein
MNLSSVSNSAFKSKVLRDRRPKRRKIEQPLLGKINTLTEKKQKQEKKFVLLSKRHAHD